MAKRGPESRVGKSPAALKFEYELPSMLKDHRGEYAVYLSDGRRVGINADPDVLINEAFRTYATMGITYFLITDTPRVLKILSPRLKSKK